ncbi:MAG: heavy-metal-associated domain-containing protein, partial [Rhizobacter sp.]|nr:heavy-metal-associated domain-containing protein [Rhizobacter sp.]
MTMQHAGLALPNPSVPPLTPRQAAALDDATALAECTRWRLGAGGEREAESVFALQGMYCAACAGIIESVLMAVPGVARADVSAAGQRVRVQWDPQRTRASQLV